MRRRSGVRTVLFWGGLSVAAISLLIEIASARYALAYTVQFRNSFWRVALSRGVLAVGDDADAGAEYSWLMAERQRVAGVLASVQDQLQEEEQKDVPASDASDALARLRYFVANLQGELATLDRNLAELAGPSVDRNYFNQRKFHELEPYLGEPARDHMRNRFGGRKLATRRPWALSGRLKVQLSPALNLAVPLWIPFALGAAAVAWVWFTLRWRPGTCGVCGYDLTGNLSGRCPECATPVPVNDRSLTAVDRPVDRNCHPPPPTARSVSP